MATARAEIRRAMPDIDLVIEILDARIPFSSENPLVAELRGEKPCVQILNKRDLADPAVTAEWLARFAANPTVRTIPHHAGQSGLRGTLTNLVRTLLPSVRARPWTAMILGIPNVGKSTIINTLAGRPIAKTANKPGVTQMQQRIAVSPELVLFDTPGMLWPKLSPEACGYRLALTGAIPDRVFDYQDIAAFAIRFLRERHPAPVVGFYRLDTFPSGAEAFLDAVARRRGYLGRGGTVDRQRAAERLVQDLRDGAFGPLSLERPGDCG